MGKEIDTAMKSTTALKSGFVGAVLLVVAAAPCAFAQESGNVIYHTTGSASMQGPGPATVAAFSALDKGSTTPVQGAPFSATITNESVQTLADGNRIVQTNTGSTARDSQGRTRQETALPPIGNLSAANAPRLVFIHDAVAQTSYTLNLTDKTAQKIPTFPPGMSGSGQISGANVSVMRMESGSVATAGAGQVGLPPLPPPAMMLQSTVLSNDPSKVSTEDLGSQTMEGVIVNGVRTTHTIAAGEIGNDKPIRIVTEVWTSPDLKTVVYSKRSDPRMGEQTFQLTNIVRAEPDASLFTVPADFKTVDGPQRIIYQQKQ
jgi:hypothetical protein